MKRTRWAGKLEATGFTLYALIFGFLGFTFMAARLPFGGSLARFGLLVLFYFAAAMPVGYFDHRFWWMAGFLAWCPVAVGLFGIYWSWGVIGFREALAIMLTFGFPVPAAFAGGWAGALWRRHKHPEELEELPEPGLHGEFPRLLR